MFYNTVRLKMSSEVFENLEDSIKSITDDIARTLENDVPRLNGERRKAVIRNTEKNFDEAFSLVNEMENEVHKAPKSLRFDMNNKVKKFRADLVKLQSKLQQSIPASSMSFTRQELFATDDEPSQSSRIVADQRSRLHQTNAVLDRTTQSIARSHQVAIETEEIGTGIVSEMGEQREALQRAQDRLRGTDANLSRSRKILKSMYVRVMTNKLILVFIILIELGILAGVVYWKFFR